MPKFPEQGTDENVWGTRLREFFSPFFDLETGSFSALTPLQAEINAIETELGDNPSGAFATVSDRLNTIVTYDVIPTMDRAAIQTVITAKNGDSPVRFAPGTYNIDVGTTELAFPAGKTTELIGAGMDKTIINMLPNGTTDSDISLGRATGTESVVVKDMTVNAPTRGSGGLPSAFQHTGTAGLIKAERCRFNDFKFALRASPGTSSTASLEAHDCIFKGDSTNSGGLLGTSAGTGNRGKYVKVINCIFRTIGEAATALTHGLYFYSDWDVLARDCRFESSVGSGYAIQIFDSTVSAANGSKNQLITGCHFGTGWGASGIVTGPFGRTLIRDNIFENANSGVKLGNGQVEVRDCIFEGVTATGFGVSASTTAINARISGCRFSGSYSKAIACDGAGKYEITDCHFEPSDTAQTRSVSVEAGTVSITDCDFYGTVTSAHIRASAGVHLEVSRNRFRTTATDCIWVPSGSTLASLIVNQNDFSQAAGASCTLTVTPAALSRFGNYGTVGYGPRILFGTGTPEGVVTAPPGSFYQRDNPADQFTIIYKKNTGTGNTGWVGA